MSISTITILNAIASAYDIDSHLYESDIADIKELVKNHNKRIADEYENEHITDKFADYYANTIKRYTAKFETVDGFTYFAGLTAKSVIPPITDSARKAFTKYAKNCKAYSNRQAVEKFNQMTGCEEENTYYTRLIKKSIYADVKIDFADSTIEITAKVNQCAKTITRVLYAIAHKAQITKIDEFINIEAVETVLDNPIETKAD